MEPLLVDKLMIEGTSSSISLSSSSLATAVSYAAVLWNDSRASLALSLDPIAEGSPPASLSLAMMSPYWEGDVRTMTSLWFLAAERTMVGPPMSIISISSESVAGGLLDAVSTKGYKFTHTRSIGP